MPKIYYQFDFSRVSKCDIFGNAESKYEVEVHYGPVRCSL